MEFDYVIVGGGSAGCALAARLSQDPATTVALLEAGGENNGILNRVPVGAAVHVMNRNACNWAFSTEPQAGLNGRRGYQPRGRGLGGSSSINAMIYLRGQPEDYDQWSVHGAQGWAWHDVLPYFLRAENNERGASQWHGVGGPVNVADLRSPNPFGALFVRAANEAGIASNADFNGARQEGAGPYQVTQKNGERWGARQAYLDPARGRANLSIFTQTRARRVEIANQTAQGVVVERAGQTQTVRARREVIVAAGALQSPQLLLLSGIGPPAHLAQFGITVVSNVPGVGQNLQDHLDIILNRRVASTDLLGLSLAGALKLARGIMYWRRERRGILTSNFAEAGAFIRTRPELARPDLQLHFVIGMVDNHNRTHHLGHGMSCHACALQPKSRGTVQLDSNDPNAAPAIDPRFLSDADDLEILLHGLKLTRRIFAQPAFAPYGGGDRTRELYFGGATSDDELRSLIRAHADTIYHPAGSCKMGDLARDPMAVVDAQLRVRAVARLRVVDASVMPTLVSGNTNAPTIMIAEKAADLLRAG